MGFKGPTQKQREKRPSGTDKKRRFKRHFLFVIAWWRLFVIGGDCGHQARTANDKKDALSAFSCSSSVAIVVIRRQQCCFHSSCMIE